MGLGGVAIVILPSIMCLKLTFSDGLGGYALQGQKKHPACASFALTERKVDNRPFLRALP